MSNTLNPHHGKPGRVVRDRRDVTCPKCGKARRKGVMVCPFCKVQERDA